MEAIRQSYNMSATIMNSQPSPLLRSLFSRSASKGKSQSNNYQPSVPSFTLAHHSSASKPTPSPDPHTVSTQLLKVAHIFRKKINNTYMFGFVKLEQYMKRHRKQNGEWVASEKESVNVSVSASVNVSVQLPITTVPPVLPLPSISKIRDDSMDEMNIEQGLDLLANCITRMDNKQREQSLCKQQGFKAILLYIARPKSMTNITFFLQKHLCQLQSAFFRRLEKYDQWKDKHQIFMMTLSPIFDQTVKHAFGRLKIYEKECIPSETTQVYHQELTADKENFQSQIRIPLLAIPSPPPPPQMLTSNYTYSIPTSPPSFRDIPVTNEVEPAPTSARPKRIILREKKACANCKPLCNPFKASKTQPQIRLKEEPLQCGFEGSTDVSHTMNRSGTRPQDYLANCEPDLIDTPLFKQPPPLPTLNINQLSSIKQHTPPPYSYDDSEEELVLTDRLKPMSHVPIQNMRLITTGKTSLSETKTALQEILAGHQTPQKLHQTAANLQMQNNRDKRLVNVHLGRQAKRGISRTPVKTGNTPSKTLPTSVGKENHHPERLLTDNAVQAQSQSKGEGDLEAYRYKSSTLKSNHGRNGATTARKMKQEIEGIINRRRQMVTHRASWQHFK